MGNNEPADIWGVVKPYYDAASQDKQVHALVEWWSQGVGSYSYPRWAEGQVYASEGSSKAGVSGGAGLSGDLMEGDWPGNPPTPMSLKIRTPSVPVSENVTPPHKATVKVSVLGGDESALLDNPGAYPISWWGGWPLLSTVWIVQQVELEWIYVYLTAHLAELVPIPMPGPGSGPWRWSSGPPLPLRPTKAALARIESELTELKQQVEALHAARS